MMADFALTSDGKDRLFTAGDFGLVVNADRDPDQVQQTIGVTLRTFQGEFFADLSFGVPWLQEILGQRQTADADSIQYHVAVTLIQQSIRAIPGVTGVDMKMIDWDNRKRKLSMQARVQTLWGPLEVTT